MDKNKKTMVLAIVAVISFIVITVGTTVAFFNYAKEGTTENTIESGSISFIYEEVNKIGNGISIEDALPTSDNEGKAQTNYFDFKVTSSSAPTVAIPYEITTRVVDGSDDLTDYVKLYLTKVSGNSEEEKVLSIYSDLDDSTNTLAQPYGDKTLYEDEIPADSTNFVENYRLRMWLDDSVDFSDESFNNKTFSIKVNVYANGEQANQQRIITANSTGIKNLTVNSVDANEAGSDKNYDFYKVVEENTTQAEIEVETDNPNATVSVENITNQAFNTKTQRLTTVRLFDLVNGDNFFRITVTSANRKHSDSYVLKVRVGEEAGLYASDGRQLASWADLVENGMNETTCGGAKNAINAVRGSETNLKLIISRSATSIANNTFQGYQVLSSVIIPDTVTTIGSNAFDGSAVTSVNLGNGVTTIGREAFKETGLTSLTIPASLTSVIEYAFLGCSNLKTLTLAEGMTVTPSLRSGYFRYVTKVNLPSTLVTISNNAFGEFTSLTDVTIPDTVTSIGANAFIYTAITSINIPSGVTSIGGSAFQNTKISSVTIPSGVTTIGDGTFKNCTNLTTVNILGNITRIGANAFYGDTNLTSITLPSTLTTLGSSSFYGTGLTSINIPAAVTSIGGASFKECSNLTSATFESPTGWKYEGWNPITLSDDATNAGYLKNRYSDYVWVKTN